MVNRRIAKRMETMTMSDWFKPEHIEAFMQMDRKGLNDEDFKKAVELVKSSKIWPIFQESSSFEAVLVDCSGILHLDDGIDRFHLKRQVKLLVIDLGGLYTRAIEKVQNHPGNHFPVGWVFDDCPLIDDFIESMIAICDWWITTHPLNQ